MTTGNHKDPSARTGLFGTTTSNKGNRQKLGSARIQGRRRGTNKPDDRSGSSGPPIGYAGRAVKLRLFALVCAVMFVLVLMFEARKPENWNWMGFEQAEEDIDTRYLTNLYGFATAGSFDPNGDPPMAESRNGKPNHIWVQESELKDKSKSENKSGQEKLARPAKDGAPKDDEQKNSQLKIAENDFWMNNYRKLNFRQRMLLLEGFYTAANGDQLDDKRASEWQRMAEELTVAQERYQADILQYLTTLGENAPERASLSETLFQLQNRWNGFQAVIDAIGSRRKLTAEEQGALNGLRSVVDVTLLEFVEDNSLQSFANDQPAMFRMIEMIKQSDDWKQKSEPEKVLFTQLYKETDRLRGRLVKFAGVMRGGYSAEPTENYLGVTKLYVSWIQIHGAQNPVAVYSLSQPDGFAIDLDDYSSSNPAELREEVEVTGMLLQKMVYAAEDGQRIAPVIFTDELTWLPKVKKDPTQNELPGLTTLVATFLSIGGLIAAITWGVISFNNRQHSDRIAILKSRLDESVDEQSVDPDSVKVDSVE